VIESGLDWVDVPDERLREAFIEGQGEDSFGIEAVAPMAVRSLIAARGPTAAPVGG
jgi:hypothetical protein